jgi:hypothetical protein
LLTAKAEGRWKVLEEKKSSEASSAPEHFLRAGYSFRWKIPVAAESVIRVYHAGAWIWNEAKGRPKYHRLWDATLETKIGQLTYFVGYQEGEAAPLYSAINTTRVGLMVTLK